MHKNNKKIIWLGLLVSLFFFSIFIFTKNIGQNIVPLSPPSSIPIQLKENSNAYVEIDGKKLETEINKEESIYDFMIRLQEEGKMNFKDKTYSGMGKLIEEINGIKNGEKNWIYYVNGKKANMGISNYKINPGDVVSWKYEENIY